VAKKPSMDDLTIHDGVLSSNNPAVRLDFGAYAKGVAVKRAIAILRNYGIENAIANAGGDLQAIGHYQTGNESRPWRIGIRHPRKHDQVLASITLKPGEAVFTSGDYERYYEYHGKRYHHILDPATGYPARGVRSVTVIHTNPALADAASTALFVAGVDDWQNVAHAMGLRYVMLVDSQGVAHLTAPMHKRLQFEIEPSPTSKVSHDNW
ncbi:MAG TPA: FAD:protein FMN transferase, partial [Gammaproteobacteria bacterium]|nr:FAD:protein FMN transferase [Gammaproteobacteria bacterium]